MTIPAQIIGGVWDELRAAMVVYLGAHFSALVALILLIDRWPEAIIDAALIGCMVGIVLAVVMALSLRRVVTVETVAPTVQAVEAPPVLPRQLPPDGFQSVVHYDAPVTWPAVKPAKLYRAFVAILREGELAVSVDNMKQWAGMNEDETAALREWFKRRGLAKDYRRGVRLLPVYREEIEYLLPRLEKIRHPRKSDG